MGWICLFNKQIANLRATQEHRQLADCQLTLSDSFLDYKTLAISSTVLLANAKCNQTK